MINSKLKGNRGERSWRDQLRQQGYLNAKRGQQFSGGSDSPDVICEELKQFHFEVKNCQRIQIYQSMEQARRDSSNDDFYKMPIVCHKKNHCDWLVIMQATDWFTLVKYNVI